jgi:hypothetical protein
MRTLIDLQKNTPFHFASVESDIRGDESLVSDIRSRVRPTEIVERKLQVALQRNDCAAIESGRLS